MFALLYQHIGGGGKQRQRYKRHDGGDSDQLCGVGRFFAEGGAHKYYRYGGGAGAAVNGGDGGDAGAFKPVCAAKQHDKSDKYDGNDKVSDNAGPVDGSSAQVGKL